MYLLIDPSGAECGNGIIEDGEQCDCGETQDQTACYMNDPCCLVNCTLKPGANCRLVSYSYSFVSAT